MDNVADDEGARPADMKQEETLEQAPQEETEKLPQREEAGGATQTASGEEQPAGNEASLFASPAGLASGPRNVTPTRARGARSPFVVRFMPVWIMALLLLLAPTLIILYNVSSASAATVTIEPQIQDLTIPYALDVSDHTDLASSKVRSRTLSYKTPAISQGASVQNTQYIPATTAHGIIIFSQISQEIKLTTFYGIKLADGTIIVMDQGATMEPGNTYTLPAHMQIEGSQGNLPADSIDGYYEVGFGSFRIGQGPPMAYLSNPDPFTGGTDGHTGPVVSQNDTDSVAANLATQVSQKAQQYFQAHLQPGEALLDNLTCQPHETDQPAIGTPASRVTVSVSSDCQIQAYDQQGLNEALQTDAAKHVRSAFDPHFVLVAPIQVTIVSTDAPGSAISLAVETRSRMALDTQGIQEVQKALAGRSQDDARNMLQNGFHCQVDSLSLSWWGGHMPANAAAIQIIVQNPSS